MKYKTELFIWRIGDFFGFVWDAWQEVRRDKWFALCSWIMAAPIAYSAWVYISLWVL